VQGCELMMRPSSAIPMPIMKKEFIADDQIDDSQLFLDDIDNDDENDDYFFVSPQ
jgi:hypothetical protein